MQSTLDVSYEQMRGLVLDVLRGGTASQLNDLRGAVAAAARKSGLIKEAAHVADRHHQDILAYRDYARVQSIMWDLIIEGVIRPGLNDGVNNALPFFHVTERGTAALEEGPAAPYDPDGYLKRLARDVPKVDSIIIVYLNESLHTFRINCLLSSTIALGCASEKALLLLIDAYAESLKKPTEQEKFLKATFGKMIKTQFDELRKAIDNDLRGRVTRELKEGLDVELNAIFDFIRQQRNDAGHPTGKIVERERAYANLVVFPTYLRKVYALIDWLAANPKT
jgi:hypothetical protein